MTRLFCDLPGSLRFDSGGASFQSPRAGESVARNPTEGLSEFQVARAYSMGLRPLRR